MELPTASEAENISDTNYDRLLLEAKEKLLISTKVLPVIKNAILNASTRGVYRCVVKFYRLELHSQPIREALKSYLKDLGYYSNITAALVGLVLPAPVYTLTISWIHGGITKPPKKTSCTSKGD